MLLVSSLASRKKPAAVTCPPPPSIVTLPAAAANEQGPSLSGGGPGRGSGEKRSRPHAAVEIRAYAGHKHFLFFFK